VQAILLLLLYHAHRGTLGVVMRCCACCRCFQALVVDVLLLHWCNLLFVVCSGVDVYTAVAGAVGALYGPLHGGANEAVLRMLERIGSVENIPSFIAGGLLCFGMFENHNMHITDHDIVILTCHVSQAAWGLQRGGAAHAGAHRQRGEHSQLHRGCAVMFKICNIYITVT
jgi:hypothetical protein